MCRGNNAEQQPLSAMDMINAPKLMIIAPMGDDGVQQALLNDGDDVDGHLLHNAQLPCGVRLVQHLPQPLWRVLWKCMAP